MNLKQTLAAASTAILLAAATVAVVPPAQAGEAAPVQIPATSAAIWQALDQQSAALTRIIQTGAYAEVHHRAFAIRDLVAALPARSGSLPAGKLAQLKTNAGYVATLAQRLDATGDAQDKMGTESNFRKLRQILRVIRADYPRAAGK